jgi:hypothetical protein
MTIDITPLRRAAACLVAGIVVVLALVWAAGDAHAKPVRASLAGAWHGYCEAGYVCLYQDANGEGRRIHFKSPRTYKLKAYSMGPGKRGVSSFWNRTSRRAVLIFPNWRANLAGHANVRRSLNDRATYVRLYK